MSLITKIRSVFTKREDVNIYYFGLDYPYEFEAKLEDHPIREDVNAYRLFYISYFPVSDDKGNRIVHPSTWYGEPFRMPIGMSREEGFKVLSYLTDLVEDNPEVEVASMRSVSTLDSILNLERFGFTRVPKGEARTSVNLYTVAGRILLFKHDIRHYPYYFNWYTENVTREEVVEIYAKCGMEYRDPVWRKKEA